jgi:hypothetical protein
MRNRELILEALTLFGHQTYNCLIIKCYLFTVFMCGEREHFLAF